MKKQVDCKICLSKSEYIFSKKILGKYVIDYYRCTNCGLVQTEEPYWLKEAYSSAIIDSDTGIIYRNIALSRMTSILLLFLGKNSKVIDYGGGYGLTTRMLRDVGIDCYWTDKYADNIFAKGFKAKKGSKHNVLTAFELFEHLEDPLKEIKQIIKAYKPKALIFSTMLHDGNPPKDWWYFATEGGQHITLYTKESLRIFAKKVGMKLSSNGKNIHVFSKKQIPTLIMMMISVLWPIISLFLPLFYKSKTFSDHLVFTKK